MEPETPPQNPLSVSAAQSPTATPSNRKQKTLGAFGKPKHLRLMRPPTFAANSVPKEPDLMAENIADELGWERK